MGRKKLAIEKIEDRTRRKVTFDKRKKGLMSKANELSVLCDIEIAVIAFSEEGKLHAYCNHNNIADFLTRYVAEVMRSNPDGSMDSMSEVQENLRKLAARLDADRDSGVRALDVQLADLQRENQALRSKVKKLYAEKTNSDMKAIDTEAIEELFKSAQKVYERSKAAKQLNMQADESGLMGPQPAAIAEIVDENTGIRFSKGVQNCNSRQTKIGRTSPRLNNGIEVESLPGKGVRNYNSSETKMRETSPSFSSNGIYVESLPCQSAQNLNSGATQVGQAKKNANNGTTPRKLRKLLPRPSAQQNFVFNQMQIDESVPLTQSLQNFNSGWRHVGDSAIPIEETLEYENRSVGHGSDFEALRSPSLYLNLDGGDSTASRCLEQEESPGWWLRCPKQERSQARRSGVFSV